MRHALLLAALLPAAAAAEPLKPWKSLPAYFGAGRWASAAEGGVVGIADLELGRQIAAIEVPVPPTRGDEKDGENTNLFVQEVSQDGKLALVVAHTRYWGLANREWVAKAASKLLLLSVADGKVLSTIYVLPKADCNRNFGIRAHCPEIFSATFSPDGTKVLIGAIVETAWSKTSASTKEFSEGFLLNWTKTVAKNKLEVLAVDLSGRTKGRYAYTGTWDDTQNQRQWEYSPAEPAFGFLADGRPALLFSGDAGCRVKELGGAAVSFLADCHAVRKPKLMDGKAYSDKSGFTVWDAATGAVLLDSPAVPKEPYAVSYDLTGWVEMTYTENAPMANIRVIDGATGKAVVERTLAAPADMGTDSLSYDRKTDRLKTTSLNKTTWKSTMHLYALGAPAVAAPLVAAPAPSAGPNLDAPPATKAKADPDAFAIVIGVEKYRQQGIPAVDFAARDAQTMSAYLTGAMGFDPKNVAVLTDDRATKTDMEKHLGKWLANRVGPKSRVFIYYAGHGSPDPTTGDAYLMPYEADPAYLEETALPLAKVYAALEKLPTKDVSVVLDACFSGLGGRSLIAKGVRPLVNTKTAKAAGNSVVLAAAGGGQISASDPARRHGLLTAALLESLHGAGDADGDGAVTAAEAFAFARPAVEAAARLQNVEQTPTLSGAGAQVWIWLK